MNLQQIFKAAVITAACMTPAIVGGLYWHLKTRKLIPAIREDLKHVKEIIENLMNGIPSGHAQEHSGKTIEAELNIDYTRGYAPPQLEVKKERSVMNTTIATAGVAALGLAAVFTTVVSNAVEKAAVFQQDQDYVKKNNTIEQNGKTYTMESGYKITEQSEGRFITYDFQTIWFPEHPDSIAFPDKAGRAPSIADPFSVSHSHSEDGRIDSDKFQDRLVVLPLPSPGPEESAIQAGCAIAAHILTLDEKEAPLHSSRLLMISDAKQFLDLCPAPEDKAPQPVFDQARFG